MRWSSGWRVFRVALPAGPAGGEPSRLAGVQGAELEAILLPFLDVEPDGVSLTERTVAVCGDRAEMDEGVAAAGGKGCDGVLARSSVTCLAI